ncbi:MAG: efflux RND transporter periplasmic adaptor subunit [Planctomycetaceae bacterium]
MAEDHRYKTILRRLVFSEVLIALLLFGSVFVFAALRAQKPEVQEKQIDPVSFNVDVFVTEEVDFRELLTGFGTARAEREVVIAAQVSGEVVEIHPNLNVGHPVVSGQTVVFPDRPSEQRNADLLLRIDPRDYVERVEQASNRVAEAGAEIAQLQQQLRNTETQLGKARQDVKTLQDEYERIKSAFDKQASSPSELNRSLLELRRYEDTIIQLESQQSVLPLQIAAAKQRLATGNSEVTRAETDLQRTSVTPPFDGIISEVTVEQGQFVRAGEPLLRLTDPDRVEIPVSLGMEDFLLIENDLQQGRRPVTSLAENETSPAEWSGQIVRISPVADASSRTVEVFVDVNNADQIRTLLPGTFVHARIDGPVWSDAIVIPREAIIEDHVFVVDSDGKAVKRRIRTGRRLQSMIVVEQGLQPGEKVILTNLDIVEDGKRVTIQAATTPADEIAELRLPVLRLLDEPSETVPSATVPSAPAPSVGQ